MTKAMACALEIAEWIYSKDLYTDVCIYVDGKRYKVNSSGDMIVDLPEADPKKYFNYAGDFLSMSFEGPLYHVMNYYDNEIAPGYDERRLKEFDKILKKYGKYYELGDAWNLSLYDL